MSTHEHPRATDLGRSGPSAGDERTSRTAVAYLFGGGVIYLALWVYGLVIGHDSAANVVPLNTADNWLHLGLGLAMVGMGLVAHRGMRGTIGGQTPM